MKFLAEVYRVLVPGGVFRASFPPIETLLRLGYTYGSFEWLDVENVQRYGHIHYPSYSELEYYSMIVGFSEMKKCAYQKSDYPDLCRLENRKVQKFSNYHVEFTKGSYKIIGM